MKIVYKEPYVIIIIIKEFLKKIWEFDTNLKESGEEETIT